MQCKFTIVVNNGMSRICSTLEPNNDIRLLAKHICDLAFAFVSPVCSYYCSYHNIMFLHFAGFSCFVHTKVGNLPVFSHTLLSIA